MKKIVLLLTLLSACPSAYALTAGDCLEESLEVAISLKIFSLSKGDCSRLGIEQFKEIEGTIQNKKRFLKNALASLNSGQKIPARFFMSFSENPSELELDKNNLCSIVSKTSAGGVKEIMKECPDGAGIFQSMLSLNRISEINSESACNKINDLKERACKESQKN